ncbi:MAG: UDP-N-acetylmuramoyl-tripeptide--D-alanyl-D-alanine ligase [Armatimonadota bacterium]
MIEATLAEVADACRGRLARGAPDQRFHGVSLDSRQTQAPQVFFALKGPHHDGHDFIPDALAAGAVAVVAAESWARATGDGAHLPDGVGLVVVEDTLMALGDLAAWHRRQFDLPVIGITGSIGKSTTKEMLAAILRRRYNVLAAEGTENNEIGVPKTLFRLADEHEIGVLELGMRGLREIAYLCEIAQPLAGIVTNVAEAHLGRLGSRRRVAAAKAELPASLPPHGFLVINADDRIGARMRDATQARSITFGIDSPADVSAAQLRSLGVQGSEFLLVADGQSRPVHLAVMGRHQVYNALAAAAAARQMSVPLADIADSLAVYENLPMRGTVVPAPGGFTIIDDSYNASPPSVRAALEVLSDAAGDGRRIVALGDMRELGEESQFLHAAVGEDIARDGTDLLVTVGVESQATARAASAQGVEAHAFDDKPAALEFLRASLRPGDTVLVKGSRAVGMDDIIRGLLGD